MRRERNKSRPFFLKDLADSAREVSWPGSLMSGAVAPFKSLAVEILQSGKAASGEERIADVPDDALDAAFLVAAPRMAGLGREMIMAAQFEQPGLETDGVAEAIQDDRFHIVVENIAGNRPPVGEGVDVSAQQALQALIEKEFKIESAAVGKSDDETGESSPRASDADLAETGPIGLSLLVMVCIP